MEDLLRSLSQQQFEWKDFNIFVIPQPELQISLRAKTAMLEPLADLINQGFGTQRKLESISKHVFGGDLLMIAVGKDGDIAGFLSSLDYEMESLEVLYKIFYLQGVVVLPEFQGLGLATKMVEIAIQLGDYTHVAMRTQNVSIYVLMSKLTSDFCPRPSSSPPTEFVEVATYLVEELQMRNFDAGTFIGRGIYDGRLTAKQVQYQGLNPAGLMFKQLGLHVDEGDCVIVVGKLE